MTSRKAAILCEVLETEIGIMEKFLSTIEEWYGSVLKEVSDKQSKMESAKNAHKYEWDDIDYELYMADKVKRVMYAGLAVALFAVAENFLFCLCVNAGIMKVEIEKEKGGSEIRKIKNCKSNEIERPNWGCYKNLIENNMSIQFNKIPCFESVNRVKLLNNCFKHSAGSINEDFVRAFGGSLGDDISYESEKWQELISGCQTFLTNLSDKLLNREK